MYGRGGNARGMTAAIGGAAHRGRSFHLFRSVPSRLMPIIQLDDAGRSTSGFPLRIMEYGGGIGSMGAVRRGGWSRLVDLDKPPEVATRSAGVSSRDCVRNTPGSPR